MYLCRGVSGFFNVDDDPPPECDLAEFRSHCCEVARKVSCSFRNIEREGKTGRNYVTNVFVFPHGDIAVLLNLHFPIIGFAKFSIDAGNCELEFVDCDQLANAFAKSGRYQVLSKSELEQPISPEEYQQLSAAEVEQATYWKPTCIGQVIFNSWD